MLYMKVAKRVIPKSSHHKKKMFFSVSLIFYLYEMIDVHQTYFHNHCMMYVNQ